METTATTHTVKSGDARHMARFAEGSIHCVVTSPPYPMIELWDPLFISQNPVIEQLLQKERGNEAFLLMHELLDPVWCELARIVAPGGFVCINIGDAARRVGERFCLYPNHALLQRRFLELGFDVLPLILWWKPTNSPNKFMGSGMLAAGAYVTLEHEYILIFRKGKKRVFPTPADKLLRRRSALFWEERNRWYADRWELSGEKQDLESGQTGNRHMRAAVENSRGSGAAPNTRIRSAAFPLELAYRLINMYSVQGDTVLDPFLGTGTTMFAAIAACRNSMGVEIDPSLCGMFAERAALIVPDLNDLITRRLKEHTLFVYEREKAGKPLHHTNIHYGFPVISSQETELFLPPLRQVTLSGGGNIQAAYSTDTVVDTISAPIVDFA